MKNATAGTILAHVFIILLPIYSGCREDSPSSTTVESLLTGPGIFVPLGTLRSPHGVAVDDSGKIWVSDTYNDIVRCFNADASERCTLSGIIRPTHMGTDRATRMILVSSDQTMIVRINPRTNIPTTVIDFDGASIDTSAIYDVLSSTSQRHGVRLPVLGDLEGATNGEIFVGVLANDAENFVIRVRGGQASAIAYSPRRPSNPRDIGTRFLSVDGFGTVYTLFVVSASPTSPLLNVFALTPGNLAASHILSGPFISSGAQGSGIDPSGLLFIADAHLRQMVIVSTISGRTFDALTIPAISGITEAVPTDIAVGPDGSVYLAISDLFDNDHRRGVVLKYTRIVTAKSSQHDSTNRNAALSVP